MIRGFAWPSSVLLLPLLGWVGLIPLLLAFPIYVDELQWKLTNSRLLLDSGKLLYLFPECAKSILLDPPISWYPLQLIDAVVYSDMTNPQILRYWGVGFFAAIVLYCAWFVRHCLRPNFGYLLIIGAVLAPLSLGLLPFLLVMNRPEQGLVMALVVACTVPSILDDRKLTTVQTWLVALLFTFLSWIMMSSHIKGLFVLPALLLAAFLSMRKWLPSLAVLGAAGFGAFETYRLWSIRTDCPESPFLMRVFRGQSLSIADLNAGFIPFLRQVRQNIWNMYAYWQSAGYQQEYQSQWLPSADTPLTSVEKILNNAIPLSAAIGVAFVFVAFALSIYRAIRNYTFPDNGPLIGMTLLGGLFCIAGFQSGKNFYETTLIFPLLAMAVMIALTTTALPAAVMAVGRSLIVMLAILAFVNESAVGLRFYKNLSPWHHTLEAQMQARNTVRDLIGRCGIEANATTKHLLVDDFTYTVLWPTREPYFLALVDGWWATGVDAATVIRDRNITGAVGACPLVSKQTWASIISQGEYCCAKRS